MEEPLEEGSYILELDFPEDSGGPLKFKDNKEIEDWLEQETSFWSWIAEGPQGNCNDNSVNNNNAVFAQYYNQLRNQYNNGHSSQPIEVGSLANVLQNLNNQGFPHSNATKAKYIKEIYETDGFHPAYAALAYSADKPYTPQLAKTLQGISKYLLLKEGVTVSSAKAMAGAFEESRNRAVGKFTHVNRKAEELVKQLEETVSNTDKRMSVLSEWSGSRWRAYKAEKDKEVQAAIEDLKSTEKTYKEYMKLKAPVTYWETKATEHATSAGKYKLAVMVYFPLSLIITLGFILFCGDYVAKYGSGVNFIAAAMVLVVTTTVLWVGRILVRLFLSEHHLGIDSKERSIMALTYLALVNDGGVEPKHTDAILSALFRPTADGIVKDDAAPMLSLPALLSGR